MECLRNFCTGFVPGRIAQAVTKPLFGETSFNWDLPTTQGG